MAKATAKNQELFLLNTYDGKVRPTSRAVWNMVKTKVHPFKKEALYQLVDADKKVIEEYDLMAAAESVKKNAEAVEVSAAEKIVSDAEKAAEDIIKQARAEAAKITQAAKGHATVPEEGQKKTSLREQVEAKSSQAKEQAKETEGEKPSVEQQAEAKSENA